MGSSNFFNFFVKTDRIQAGQQLANYGRTGASDEIQPEDQRQFVRTTWLAGERGSRWDV